MSLIEDIKASFKSKGLEYVSLEEDAADPKKSILTYRDGSGNVLKKEIGVRLSELEETISELDNIDPEDLADYLLG